MAARKRRIFAWSAGALVAFALVGGTWGVATLFRSPEQVAADSKPPVPSRITSPVIEGTLGHEITVSGKVVRASQVDVLVGAAGLVVTASPLAAGSTVSAGALVAEVNGEPVFLFSGQFPMYRDLKLGDTGPDVELIQRSLAESGLSVSVDGKLGPNTAREIDQLYRNYEYELPAGESPIAPLPRPQDPAPTTSPSPAAEGVADSRVVLPKAHVIVTPGLPATVITTPPVGLISDKGGVISLGTGEFQVRARVSAGTGLGLKAGMPCRLTQQGFETVDGTVLRVGSEPAEDGTVELVLQPASSLGAPELGADVVAGVTVDDGGGTSLIVPTRSVVVRGDDMFVRKVAGGEGIREVPVRELGSSLGKSAVAPIEEGALLPGDEVVVE